MHQPLQAPLDGLAGDAAGGGTRAFERIANLFAALFIARPHHPGVQHQLLHPFRKTRGEPYRDHRAERFARQDRGPGADRVEEIAQMVGEVVELVRDIRAIGEAVADHIDRVDVKMLGVLRQVARVGLDVAAGAVQQDERRAGTGLDRARANRTGAVESLLHLAAHPGDPNRFHRFLPGAGASARAFCPTKLAGYEAT